MQASSQPAGSINDSSHVLLVCVQPVPVTSQLFCALNICSESHPADSPCRTQLERE